MELVRFSIRNYRSITTAYKLPCRKATVLIGPNNEGKSNILRALATSLELLSRLGGIKLQSRGRIYRPSERLSKLYDWFRDYPVSLQASNPDGRSVFDLELLLSESETADFLKEVKSSLNGTLQIELSCARDGYVFKVKKRGPGGAALSKKQDLIAQFISKRMNFEYIPAVRTAESANEIVAELVEKELALLESADEYKKAIKLVADIQQPVLDRISQSIKETLKDFLPNVKEVRVRISEEARYRALRRSEVIVDDGTPTPLSNKGDGVQSLAALSLMRYSSERGGSPRNLILAIEEPESHLHPNAVHQLKEVISVITRKHQVIMTTHCPLFVDRASINSNILVHDNKAVPAVSIKQIRDILGIRASDNLQNSELMLVVEGEDDRRSLLVLLAHHSRDLSKALSQQVLGIESLQGGSNLSYKLSQIREALCQAHTFLDHDACGIAAAEKAKAEGLLETKDEHYAICPGLKESEFEDILDEKLYADMLLNKYGVSIQAPQFKSNFKWSDRIRNIFTNQGKTWSKTLEMNIKLDVVALVESRPTAALNPHKRSSFDALLKALELKIKKSSKP